MMKLDKKTILGLVWLGAFVGLIVYLLFPLGLIKYFTDKQLLMTVIAEHRAHAVAIFIGLQALQVVAAPVPGEVTGFAGGMLFGTLGGILYSTIGLTLGSWFAFMIARYAGRPFVEKVVDKATMKRFDYVMKHKGLFLAFLLFLMPGFPKDYLCYLLGVGHMTMRNFLIVSTIGRLFGTILLTLGGSFFRDKHYGALFTLTGVCVFFILITMIYRKRIEQWFRDLRARHLRSTRTEEKHAKKHRSH
jgi:uncharacterized membrane protein YdjX (TVP38/TMEM64 family)